MKISPNKWLISYQPIENPKINLICFPYGGGAASVYREWQKLLPPGVQLWAVQYPGRENRFNESYAKDAAEIVSGVIADLKALSIDRVSLFGHSMGAHYAWYCVQQLMSESLVCDRLFLSGNKPPHVANEKKWSDSSEAELEAHVLKLGGMPDELKSDKDFLAIYLEKIRADYEMYERTPAKNHDAVPVPLVAIRGEDDPLFSAEEFEQWRDYSSQKVDLEVFAGDHFYFLPYHKPLLRVISNGLRSIT